MRFDADAMLEPSSLTNGDLIVHGRVDVGRSRAFFIVSRPGETKTRLVTVAIDAYGTCSKILGATSLFPHVWREFVEAVGRTSDRGSA